MAHVATITIDHTKVPGDLTDYVGLIVPDASAGYSALYALCLEGGGDLRLFKSDDTTELAREIVTFSVSAETGEIHYRYAGTLSSSVDTPIHVYADGSSADYAVTATYGRNAVWDDYAGVWHMQESTTAVVDSTGNTGNGSTGGGTPSMQDTSAPFGEYSVNLNGGNIEIPHNSAWDFGLNSYSYQQWVVPPSAADAAFHTFMKQGGNIPSNRFYMDTRSSSDKVEWYIVTQATDLIRATDNSSGLDGSTDWFALHGVRDQTAGTSNLYINGTLRASTSESGNSADSTAVLNVGNNSTFKSREVRIYKDAFSANKITAEYNNQDSYSTFYSVAAVGGGSAAQAARRGAVMMM